MSAAARGDKPLVLAAIVARAFNTVLDSSLPYCSVAWVRRREQDLNRKCGGDVVKRLREALSGLKPGGGLGEAIDSLFGEGRPPGEIIEELVAQVARNVHIDSGGSACADAVDDVVRKSVSCYISLTSVNPRRCEALPPKVASFVSLAATYGLGVALNFYISKANRDLYWVLYNALAHLIGGNKVPHDLLIEAASMLPPECRDGGESATLAMAVHGLEAMGVLRRPQGSKAGTSLGALLILYDEIVDAEASGSLGLHRRRALDYLTFLKRYIDGLYG